MKSFKEARTDPHRPSVMDPAEYVFVGAADDHPGDSYLEIRHDILAKHGVETGSSDRHSFTNVPFYDARADGRPNYRCHHCGKHGSNIRYFVFFLHKPSKQVIVVGQICARKLELGSREELDFQRRADEFRRMRARHEWVERHGAEYNFLKDYDEKHRQGGKYIEFLSSLWEGVQQFGSLTDRQLEALHRWMERQQEWQAERRVDVSSERPATQRQIDWIGTLSAERGLDNLAFEGMTMRQASETIDRLKSMPRPDRAQASEQIEPATEKQISFINGLMDTRQIAIEQRREARTQLDAGLSKAQASEWIKRLLELPKIEQ